MPGKSLLACMGLACCGALFWQPEAAIVANADGGETASKKLKTLYFGVSLCSNCHDKPAPVADKDALLYRGTEMHDWDKFDKHKDATRVLSNERSKQMAVNLGWKNIHQDARCLNCHGVVVKNEREAHESFQVEQREESGVSCVVCHGAVQEWVDAHASVTGGAAWKKLKRAEKKRDFGLNDLWDPVTRAALCTSCHVGNVQEGKVVTHEMYAAGHPPLPGIEIATFSDAMPRHWEMLSEKVNKRKNNKDYQKYKDFYKDRHGYDADGDDNEQTRMLTISSVVAFRASMQLIHDMAQKEAANPDAKDAAWPELAAFDCYACHHDLQSKSWRQLRGYKGRPGRPQMRPWSTALLDLGIQHASGPKNGAWRSQYEQKIKALEDAFSDTPFGEPRAVADKAGALVSWSNDLLKALEKKTYDGAATHVMLQGLLKRGGHDLVDFDSARQISWGVTTLLAALEPHKKREDVENENLQALLDPLQLRLPKGQQPIADKYLPEVLNRLRAYDPRVFQKAMRDLAATHGK